MSGEWRSRDKFADGFWVGDWFVEPMLNRIRLEEEETEVQLEPKVMEVLLCLADHPKKTVTKEQFKEEVWADTVVTDDVLSRCISELRKVFNDDSRDPSYIETIRKTGYRLIAPVRTSDAGEASSEAQASLDGPEAAGPGKETHEPQGLVDRIARTLKASWTEAQSWGAGGKVDRRWLVGVGVLVAALLLIRFVTGPGGEDDTDAEPPTPAIPLTSFPGEEFDPALSSSGRQVVFAWRNADSLYQNIYLMQREAEQPLQLSEDATVDWSPAWSPQGRHVAYAREADGEHQVSIVPSIGGRTRVVASMPDRRIHSIAWSPDTLNTTLAISAEQRPHRALGLSLLFPNSDSARTITAPPLWSTGDRSPVFSPDGSRIAFVRGRVEGVEDVFVVPSSGGEPSRVTTDSTTIHGLAWSQSGDEIIYSAHRGGVSGLWRVDANGGAPSLIRAASEGTVFRHPTVVGQRLAYTQQSAQSDIWTLSRRSRYEAFQTSKVVSSTQEDTSPSISPDGTQLAFISDRSGTPEVWAAQMDGSAPTQITSLNGPDIRSVTWSSDGTRLSFVARRNGRSNLFSVPASGGGLSQLTDTSAAVLAPRWGRNDRWIYFASNQTGRWEIWRTSPKTSQTQQVTTGGAVAAQESPTGSTLYVVRSDTMGIWAAPLDTARFPLRTHRDTTRTEDSLLAYNSASSSGGTSSSGGMDVLRGISELNKVQESPFDQVVAQFDPQDQLNWGVGSEGMYFLHHRRFRTTVLTYHDFTSGQRVPLYTFPDWHTDRCIAAGPGGNAFAYTQVARRESDVMLLESIGQ